MRLPPAAPLFSNALPSVSEVRTGQLAAGTCAGLLRRRSSGKALTVEKRGRGEAWCRVIQRHPGRREGCDSSHSPQSIQSDRFIKVIYEECKSESAIQKVLMRAQLSTSPVRDRALRGASFQSHLCPAGQPPTSQPHPCWLSIPPGVLPGPGVRSRPLNLLCAWKEPLGSLGKPWGTPSQNNVYKA